MSSGKRYNDANLNSYFDKPSSQGSASTGASSGVVHKGMLILQGHRATQRTRLAPHPSSGKLAVPKPVNLPSLRKENQGNDPTTQLVPASGVSGSWYKNEDSQASVDVNSCGKSAWHTSSGNANYSQPQASQEKASEGVQGAENGGPDRQDSQFLNQEEYPTLEAATHSKPVTKIKKQETSPKSSRGTPKESQDAGRAWSEDDRPSQRRSWFEDDRLAPSESFGGYSSWGDTEYRPPAYGSRSGRTSYESRSLPYYGPDVGAYSVPETEHILPGYVDSRGAGHSYMDACHRDVYRGHHQHPPYLAGGGYHNDYQSHYEHRGDPYMDRSLFPPPPPPPPRSKEGDLDGFGHKGPCHDPEREEYDAELKKRAIELGAKMDSDQPAESAPSESQTADKEDADVMVYQEINEAQALGSNSYLATLPVDDSKSTNQPGSLFKKVSTGLETTLRPSSKESGQTAIAFSQNDSSTEQDFPSLKTGKGLDWEAQVDAEEKAIAARRERAMRDVQMQLEPPTLLKPSQKSDESPTNRRGEDTCVQATSMSIQTSPRRHVKTQSIGIQAQPPTPPTAAAAAAANTKASVNDLAVGHRRHDHSISHKRDDDHGPVKSQGQPRVPGPWGQRPPASVQAQRQVQAVSRTESGPRSPHQLNGEWEESTVESQSTGVIQSEHRSKDQVRPERESRDAVQEREVDSFGRGYKKHRDDQARHSRDFSGSRHARGRGNFRGRGRGVGQYESRADQADWRQPRDPEAKQHLGKLRSDYVVAREDHRVSTSSTHDQAIGMKPREQFHYGSDASSLNQNISVPPHQEVVPGPPGKPRNERPSSYHSQRSAQAPPPPRNLQENRRATVEHTDNTSEHKASINVGQIRRQEANKPFGNGQTHLDSQRGHRAQNEKGRELHRGNMGSTHQDYVPHDHRSDSAPSTLRNRQRNDTSRAGEVFQRAAPKTHDQQMKSIQKPRQDPTPELQREADKTGLAVNAPHRSFLQANKTHQAKTADSKGQSGPRIPLASGVGSHLQSANQNAPQKAHGGQASETPIQFGQFHMRSLLYGMPGGTFSAPPGEFGSLNTSDLTANAALPLDTREKDNEPVATTGQGVSCLPHNLIESSPKSERRVESKAAPEKLTNPELVVGQHMASSQKPESSAPNLNKNDRGGLQGHGQSNRGRHPRGRSGKSVRGRNIHHHDQRDNRSDQTMHVRKQSTEHNSSQMDGTPRESRRDQYSRSHKGHNEPGNSTNREPSRPEGSTRVAQGPDRHPGGRQSFGRGRGDRGRGMRRSEGPRIHSGPRGTPRQEERDHSKARSDNMWTGTNKNGGVQVEKRNDAVRESTEQSGTRTGTHGFEHRKNRSLGDSDRVYSAQGNCEQPMGGPRRERDGRPDQDDRDPGRSTRGRGRGHGRGRGRGREHQNGNNPSFVGREKNQQDVPLQSPPTADQNEPENIRGGGSGRGRGFRGRGKGRGHHSEPSRRPSRQSWDKRSSTEGDSKSRGNTKRGDT